MQDHELVEQHRKFGLIRQLPDLRDHPNSLRLLAPREFESSIDLREIPEYPDSYDQSDEGSCTGNGGGGAVHYNLVETKYPWPHTPSRQFIYYNTRTKIEGNPADQDTGATIRGTFQALSKFGVCPENGNPDWSWPYHGLDNYAIEPPPQCYKDARLHVALKYETVQQEHDAILSVLSQGFPIVIGFTVHNSFMTSKVAKSGIMPKPKLFDRVAGGHCVMVVGYKLNFPAGDQGIKDWAICRNSWGKGWGMDGHFLMPLKEVLLNPHQSCDFWFIRDIGFGGWQQAA